MLQLDKMGPAEASNKVKISKCEIWDRKYFLIFNSVSY